MLTSNGPARIAPDAIFTALLTVETFLLTDVSCNICAVQGTSVTVTSARWFLIPRK